MYGKNVGESMTLRIVMSFIIPAKRSLGLRVGDIQWYKLRTTNVVLV